jgi:hypothetical protein
VLKAWEIFAKDYSFDAMQAAGAAHGRRLYDTLKEFCRIDEGEKLQVRDEDRVLLSLVGDSK